MREEKGRGRKGEGGEKRRGKGGGEGKGEVEKGRSERSSKYMYLVES